MNDGTLKYGRAGADLASASANFIGARFNGLSLSCTPIELLSNDGQDKIVGTGTGFFWRKGENSYLITNWHVVSGRNSLTGDLNSNGYVPQRICFYGLSVEVLSGQLVFTRRRYMMVWQQDMIDLLSKLPQINGQNIDIWGCPVPEGLIFRWDAHRTGFQGAAEASCLINDNANSRIVTNVGDDCFILGYPLQNYDGLMPPVWKRGSIASETLIGIDGRPIFLVDAATTSGMSGSPIIRKATTITAMNQNVGAIQEFSTYDLIGVYAGRLEGSKFSAINIGYGWYKSMIDEILEYYQYSSASTTEIH